MSVNRKVIVNFSGGKDSTVMLHLVADEARKRGRRFGVLFVDLEGQYKLTIESVRRCLAMYEDCADPYWICLPIHLRNAVSVYEPFWTCWEPDAQPQWIREPPADAITDPDHFAGMNEAYAEFFPDPKPARTTVVTQLVGGIKVEIDCVAVAPAP